MVIFVSGEDSFRVAEKTAELVAAFSKKYDPSNLNIDRIDGERVSAEEFSSAVRSQPFLAVRRMAVVRGLLGRKGEKKQEGYAEALKTHLESVVVVLSDTVSAAALQKHALRKAAGKDAVEYVYPLLSGAALEKWVKERFATAGAVVTVDVVRALAARVGSDLWRMNQEIEKLAAYCFGRTVSRADVDLLVERHVEENVFALTDALGNRRTNDALRLLTDELAAGSEPYGLFALLGRQVRLLAQTASYLATNAAAGQREVADSLGLHPFVAQKVVAQARGFTPERVAALHASLLAADRAMKTGRASPEDALRDFLVCAAN